MRVKQESEKPGLKQSIKKKTKIQGIGSHHFVANKRGKSGSSDKFRPQPWAPESLWMVIAAMKLKDSCSLEGKLWPT